MFLLNRHVEDAHLGNACIKQDKKFVTEILSDFASVVKDGSRK